MRLIPHLSAAAIPLLFACNTGSDPAPSAALEAPGNQEPLFATVPPDSSGIRFANMVREDESQNYFIYEYMYNGGGVAVGDLNNDGLDDVWFTGNLVGDKIYLNKGGLRFTDITDTAIEEGDHGWHSGVTMADVNGDGLLDVYVCRAGWWDDPQKRANLYYQNLGPDADGIPHFTERAQELGIADTTRSTQAAFFDADGDQDLDLFVMNCPKHSKRTLNNVEVAELVRTRKSATSRLYRNDGEHFTDVTAEAGLWSMGFGLGLAVSDLDNDGDRDIYMACDYIEPDKMYLNDGHGHFTDRIVESTRHISNFGMGCDAADYDNDGLTDITVLDMVSEDHVRSKKNMGAMSPEKFWGSVAAGYQLQYMFNTLQHNNGNGTFGELGQLAGMSKTDWSWSALFCDLDNDGWKDLFITNGYKRDARDNDYAAKAKEISTSGTKVTYTQMLDLIPTTRIGDYAYRNNGDLTFTNVSEDWGLATPSNDNGAAYADLDNDGDLDLLVNNMDETASLYENRAVQQQRGNWLTVEVEGAAGPTAMGAVVTVKVGDRMQRQELIATRGYESSVPAVAHFGLGAATTVDEVRVRWPDGMESVQARVNAATRLKVERTSAKPAVATNDPKPLLAEVSDDRGLDFTHHENAYDDFASEVLLPQKQSTNGPLLGAGDVNGDGLDDLYIGGARDQSGELFLQRTDGSFSKAPSQPWAAQRASEDMGSLFFDADGDKDLDLFVASGSNEVDMPYELYASRIYLNDGKGNFTYMADALPVFQTSAFRAAAADIDADGDQDLFVGGRITPGEYPRAPRSYLLLNDGAAHFSDATEQLAPQLVAPGLVTDAEFVDYDGDKDPDLVVVGEWMAIGFYENTNGRFTQANEKSGLKDTEGWWWSLTSGDIDNDGDMDMVCGGHGWNNKFHCSPEHPFHVYWNDFDGNGHGDIVLAKENPTIGLVPVRGRQCSSQQCAMIADKFPTFDAFAHANLSAIYTPEKLSTALHLEAKHMRSCVLLNQGGGRFTLTDLPNAAQTAPVMGSILVDLDGDGKLDLVVAGNHWGAEVETVRYDGGIGCVLMGDGKGGFAPLPPPRSGFFAWKNAKDVALLRTGAKKTPLIVVANNNDRVQAFAPRGNGSLLAQGR